MSPVKGREAPGSLRKPGKYSGLARALSKLGFCSRSQARILIEEGKVQVDGVVRRDPEFPILLHTHRISVAQKRVEAAGKVYLMLNKPRGLVTTTADERGRDTVYSCFKDLPFVAPVGRLDKASEGLLLFTNDTEWADRVTNPRTHLEKTYHVQINCVGDETLIQRLSEGIEVESEFLRALRARVLRQGEKNSWLEIVLEEGRNRHIRRLIEALGHTVLRLVRVSIGSLELGNLVKGNYRYLSQEEVRGLGVHKG